VSYYDYYQPLKLMLRHFRLPLSKKIPSVNEHIEQMRLVCHLKRYLNEKTLFIRGQPYRRSRVWAIPVLFKNDVLHFGSCVIVLILAAGWRRLAELQYTRNELGFRALVNFRVRGEYRSFPCSSEETAIS